MSENNELKQAQSVYKALCQMLDDLKWTYEKHDEELTIKCTARGEDLPMDITVEIDQNRKLITLISSMPFTVPEEHRNAIAVAVSKANYGMVDGSFDYNYTNGRILFRMTSSYRESLIGKRLFEYMIMVSCHTIDEYNDKFFFVSKNNMSTEEILDYIK